MFNNFEFILRQLVIFHSHACLQELLFFLIKKYKGKKWEDRPKYDSRGAHISVSSHLPKTCHYICLATSLWNSSSETLQLFLTELQSWSLHRCSPLKKKKNLNMINQILLHNILLFNFYLNYINLCMYVCICLHMMLTVHGCGFLNFDLVFWIIPLAKTNEKEREF